MKRKKLAWFQKRLVENFVDPGVSVGFDFEELLVGCFFYLDIDRVFY